MLWDRFNDTLSIKFNHGLINRPRTKRKSLAFYASIYEPLGLLTKLKIPQSLWSVTPINYELHIFCDASKRAYACVAYLVHHSHNTKDSAAALISAKTRLSPLKVGAEIFKFKKNEKIKTKVEQFHI